MLPNRLHHPAISWDLEMAVQLLGIYMIPPSFKPDSCAGKCLPGLFDKLVAVKKKDEPKPVGDVEFAENRC